ncbi:MAG TPA: hypothetical protein DCZ03_06635 [Gammaproteobacteria bacterium]|nr:hypothetical protein [Gammaproteobacteria bacterium]
MNRRQGCLHLLLIILVCGTISGCTHLVTPQLIEPIPASPWQNTASIQWHKVKFKIAWPEDEQPSWHLDALIAHQVIAPILQEYKTSIPLWRFHRRASKDATGHQFSFMFYADNQQAKLIQHQLVTNSLLVELVASQWVRILDASDVETATLQPIAATSDKTWPPIIQQAWPHYIMGVSAFWLDLIDRQTRQSPLTAPDDLSDILAYYQQQHDQITLLWQEHGQHALLHHLNALFAYQPLHIIEHRLLRY